MPSIYLHRLTLSLDGNMLFSGVYTLVENTRLPLCVRVYVCGVGAWGGMWRAESHIREEPWDLGLSHAIFNLRAGHVAQQESLLWLGTFLGNCGGAERESARAAQGRVCKPELSLGTLARSLDLLLIENIQICKLQRVSNVPSQAGLAEIPQTWNTITFKPNPI